MQALGPAQAELARWPSLALRREGPRLGATAVRFRPSASRRCQRVARAAWQEGAEPASQCNAGTRASPRNEASAPPSGAGSSPAGGAARSRREALCSVALLSCAIRGGWRAGDGRAEAAEEQTRTKRRAADEDKGPEVVRYFKTPGGAKVEEVVVGSGNVEAALGDLVTFHYVCRRSNGYFVASTQDPLLRASDPVQLQLEKGGQIIEGLAEVMLGMRAGGKRRALVPPELGYVSSDLQPQPQEFDRQRSLLSHASEPLVFEIQLLNVRRPTALS